MIIFFELTLGFTFITQSFWLYSLAINKKENIEKEAKEEVINQLGSTVEPIISDLKIPDFFFFIISAVVTFIPFLVSGLLALIVCFLLKV